MRRRITSTIAVALVLALVVPAAALAGPAQPVTFHGTFSEGTGIGTFYGFPDPACESGTTSDEFKLGAGFQSNRKVQLLLDKVFTCAGSGDTFTLQLTVHILIGPVYGNHFTWTVVNGTGHLASMRGAGTGSAVPTDEGGLDTYTGQLVFD